MTPSVVHRYSFRVTEAIEALIGDAASDCEALQLRVDGDLIVIDVVTPTAPAGQQPKKPLLLPALPSRSMNRRLRSARAVRSLRELGSSAPKAASGRSSPSASGPRSALPVRQRPG